ncbi:MAG: alpha/beta fold hydrolase [Chloroflexota bacterium]|nr:alpha/beta fold hydrolase [Chloroflexota bacterium]
MDARTKLQQEERAQMITVGCQCLSVAIHRGDGTRTPLLLMPGIGSGLEMFEPFVEALDPSIEVIRFDIPGTGASPTPVSPYSIVSLTYLVGKMLDQLGYRQVDVLGFSWGGSLAQQFALQFPRRCRRLILGSTGTGVTMVPGQLSAMLQLLTPWSANGEPFFLKELIPTREANPEVTRAFMRAISPLNQRGYVYQLVAAMSWTSLPWLWSLRQPTLILAGDDDPIVPMANARILRAGIFHSQLYVYHGGHMGVLTNAKELARVSEQFLLS